MILNLLVWVVLGWLGGMIANWLMGRGKVGFVMNTILGIFGAVLGGWIIYAIGGAAVTGLNPYSVIVAVFGSLVVLWLANKLAGPARG